MSSPSTGPLLEHIPSLGDTYGALLLGTFLGLILYGVTLHQAYRYARRQNLADSWYTMSFVCFIVTFDTIFTILSMHASYWYLVTNFFGPLHLFTGVWSLDLIPVTTGIGIVACQAFFAYRVYAVGRRYRLLVALTAIMILAVLGLAIMATIKAFTLPDLQAFGAVAQWSNAAAFAIAVSADVMLTTVLIRVLHRSRTGFRRTDSIIDVLIAYSVTTGLITDVVGLVCLITALVRPGDLIYAACNMVCAKLYVNCVLATLNSRPGEASPLPTENDPRVGAMRLTSLTSSEATINAPPPLPGAPDNGQWDPEVLHIKPTDEFTSFSPRVSPF